MNYKPAQKRIYFEGAMYFVTCNTKNWIKYLDEPILCEAFISLLKVSKEMCNYNLFAFVVLIHHFHLLFHPHEAKDLSNVMKFLKRNFTRNANYILGFESEESFNKSLLKLTKKNHLITVRLRKLLNIPILNYNFHNPPNKYAQYKPLIEEHYDLLRNLRKQFVLKYGDQHIFPKFKWHKSFHDHYIRNDRDFDYHVNYIYNNPFKHNVPDPENYQYIFTRYPELINE